MLITVWVTNQCNLQCRYCYENKNNNIKRCMNIENEDDVIRYIVNNLEKENVIIYHGGEPLLNWEFIKKATKEIKKFDPKCRFGLTTNGTIWNQEIESFLKEYKESFSDWISVSIDGSKQYHDLNRVYKNGKGTYDEVEAISKKMLNIFPDIRVRMTVTSENIMNLANNVDLLISMGFKKIVPSLDMYDKKWKEQHFETLSKEYDSLLEKYDNNPEIVIGLLEECKYLRKKNYCTLSPNIYVDGKIYPCIYAVGDEKFIIGNINKGIDIKKKTAILDKVQQDNEECKGCTNINYCLYNRCKFLNYYVEGDCFSACTLGCLYENFKYEKMNKYINDKKSITKY